MVKVPFTSRVWRFSVCLWLVVGLIAWFSPWPFGLAAVLFATCLSFAALETPAQRRLPGK